MMLKSKVISKNRPFPGGKICGDARRTYRTGGISGGLGKNPMNGLLQNGLELDMGPGKATRYI